MVGMDFTVLLWQPPSVQDVVGRWYAHLPSAGGAHTLTHTHTVAQTLTDAKLPCTPYRIYTLNPYVNILYTHILASRYPPCSRLSQTPIFCGSWACVLPFKSVFIYIIYRQADSHTHPTSVEVWRVLIISINIYYIYTIRMYMYYIHTIEAPPITVSDFHSVLISMHVYHIHTIRMYMYSIHTYRSHLLP